LSVVATNDSKADHRTPANTILCSAGKLPKDITIASLDILAPLPTGVKFG
jgi:hypothetical protein